jgi:cytochrome c
MDSFEFNKIAGAVLATALGVMALSIVSEVIYHPAEAEQPGYVVAGVDPAGEEHGAAGGGEPAEEVPPIALRLQTADLAAGERSLTKCQACHTFNEGDARRTPGPNLWGIVGAPVAHLEGFAYSEAMQEKHAEGMTWTFENLDEFLQAPRADIPGTAMTFAGLKRVDERTNVIAYLRTLSNSPVPLPEPPTTAPAETPAAAVEPPVAPSAQVPAGEPALPDPGGAQPAPATTAEPAPETSAEPSAH